MTLIACSSHRVAFIQQLHWNVHHPPFPLLLTATHLSQYLNLCHPQCLSGLLCVVSMYLAQDYYCLNFLLQLLLFLITITKPDNNSWLKVNKSCSYGVIVNYWQATWHFRSHQDIILTLRLLMSYIYIYIYIYIYGAPILDVSRSHTTTQHSR